MSAIAPALQLPGASGMKITAGIPQSSGELLSPYEQVPQVLEVSPNRKLE
jgi:hypothetical protein